jgi:hypothetical protein
MLSFASRDRLSSLRRQYALFRLADHRHWATHGRTVDAMPRALLCLSTGASLPVAWQDATLARSAEPQLTTQHSFTFADASAGATVAGTVVPSAGPRP